MSIYQYTQPKRTGSAIFFSWLVASEFKRWFPLWMRVPDCREASFILLWERFPKSRGYPQSPSKSWMTITSIETHGDDWGSKLFKKPSYKSIWVGYKITYRSQWTWPKWVVPYRLWIFSHKFEHPKSTPWRGKMFQREMLAKFDWAWPTDYQRVSNRNGLSNKKCGSKHQT